jgi:hypothetical protein
MRADHRQDLPERILATCVKCLPADRVEWADAMLGELASIARRGERWRFATGCARVALTSPWSRGAPGRSVVIAMGLGAVACVGTVGLSIARYPAVITGRSWLAIAVFVVVVAGYLVAAAALVRWLEGSSRGTIRVAMLGATGIAALWVAIGGLASYAPSKTASTALMLALPVASFGVGVAATNRSGTATATAGRYASLLAGLGAGLLGFVVWMGNTLVTAGGPYDPGMRRDFASSGARDLATYAVSDNLGSAMMLLLLIPVLAGSFGIAGVAATNSIRRQQRASE